ncbi:hypothetical protein [Bacillus sp. FJAT-29814]|uniref:hypothetical protein n=1 Tax=Bacillus sp. FJAT-29814 TaxID=1729688 RepID=UPI000832DE09|nr:hypothetical protein [Bacillus sp. FJAT-29814]
MKLVAMSGYEKLRHIYENNLTVELLAENLTTCNVDDQARDVKNTMSQKDYDIFGVRDKDRVIGFVKRDDLNSDQKIENFVRKFSADDLISDSTSLIDLLDIFQDKEFIFILERNSVSKIVTVADLQKQPIRMLAFSLISLLEMYLLSLIKGYYSNESWIPLLSESRLDMAKKLMEARMENNEALTLLDNTQLGDKGTIVQKTQELVDKLGFESKSQCRDFFKKIEKLRNNTAHSQQKIYHDNNEFIALILQIERVIKNSI